MNAPRQLSQLIVKNRRILLRADFNVPLFQEPGHHEPQIRDDSRIRAALPTIEWLLKEGARVIAMSHLGSPKGPEHTLSLRPVATRLEELLGEPVAFASDCIGPATLELVASSQARVILLENLRFHEGEKSLKNEPDFVNQLALLGDGYVNDAFGTAHREDSSCVALAHAFNGRTASGLLLSKELDFLDHHVTNPDRPFLSIIGGAKISSKLGVLDRLLERCDHLAIVGAMAYTFLLAQGIRVGRSLCEPDCVEKAQSILARAQQMGKPLLLPQDIVVTSSMDSSSIIRLVPADQDFPDGFEGVDIGQQTVRSLQKVIQDAKTIFWNGPAGIFEQPRFGVGTRAIANLLTNHAGITIVGGGDSAAAVNEMGLANRFSHVSTGGGASLELIEKGDLPALKALRETY